MHNRIRIAFFDRDGIVNERIEGGYVRTPREFIFRDGFFELFSWVKEHGYRAIVVSNQQGVAKGIMNMEDLNAVTEWMQYCLRQKVGSAFDDIYYCTELDGPAARCRKPQPTMLLDALKRWDGDTTCSWMIGDMPSDVEAAVRAGVRAILVGNYTWEHVPDAFAIVPDLLTCLDILRQYAIH